MRIFGLLILLMALVGLSGCTHPKPTGPIKLTLPADQSPTAIFTTSSPFLVVKAATRSDRFLYSWRPGEAPKLLARGDMLEVSRLANDVFVAMYSTADRSQFVATLDGQNLTSQPLRLPPGGPTGWGGCDGNTKLIVCTGNRPDIAVDDKDYDTMGFSAVLVVDFAHGETKWFAVNHWTDIRFDSKSEVVFARNSDSAHSKRKVEVFNLDGKLIGDGHLSDLQMRSPSGHFVRSLQLDGSEGWTISNADDMKALLSFNCDKQGCLVGDDSENSWNPAIEGQVAVLSDRGEAYGKGAKCEIYRASPPQLLNSFPCDGMPVYDWSRDGKRLVTLSYKGAIYSIHDVN